MKFLVLDVPGLHPGFLGCYGNDWIDTPSFDRLACEGIVADRHIYDTPGSLRSGRLCFPNPQGASAQAAAEFPPILQDANVVVREIRVQDAGMSVAERIYETAMRTLQLMRKKLPEKCLIWVTFPSLAPPWNFPADLLDMYADEEQAESTWADPPPFLSEEASDADVIRLQNTYAAVVTYVDAQIEMLREGLSKRYLDEMAICLTSSEPLPLGEHGQVGCQKPWLHEEMVHLPLLMRLPGAAASGLRLAALTQPVDLLPTLLDVWKIPAAGVGQTLWPAIRGDADGVRGFACSARSLGGEVEWSLRTRRWAYLSPRGGETVSRGKQLYVKPDDRWEVNDVSQHHQDLIEELESELQSWASTQMEAEQLR